MAFVVDMWKVGRQAGNKLWALPILCIHPKTAMSAMILQKSFLQTLIEWE